VIRWVWVLSPSSSILACLWCGVLQDKLLSIVFVQLIRRFEFPTLFPTNSALTPSVRHGLASLWQRGDSKTTHHRNLLSYNVETLHGRLRQWSKHTSEVLLESAGLHAYVKYALLSTFLPHCLIAFFLPTCLCQTDWDNFTHNGSKDAVRPSQQVFFSI